jgi:heme exporter protein C
LAWTWFHRFGSPPHFYRIAGTLIPWFAWPAVLCSVGLVAGRRSRRPTTSRATFRIICVHAPSAGVADGVHRHGE